MLLTASRTVSLGEHECPRGLQDRVVCDSVGPIMVLREVTLSGGEVAFGDLEQATDLLGTCFVRLDAILLNQLLEGHLHLR